MNGLNRPSFERALWGFQSIMDVWGVERRDGRVLLGLAFHEDPWTRLDALSAARRLQIEKRIRHVGGIYRSLRETHPEERQAREWMNTPLQAFGGDTPLGIMLRDGEEGLLSVLGYLHLSQTYDSSATAQPHSHQ